MYEPKHKTVAIIGSHPATRRNFSADEAVDVWVFNEAVKTETNAGWAERADLVFQLHDPVIWRNPQNRNDPKHYDWLKSGKTPPIVMQKRYDDVPQSFGLPKDEILAHVFGKFSFKGYVTSSVAWAVLYAVYLGYEKLIILGVELETNTEYQYQQGSFAHAVGVALGAGCTVETPAKMFDWPLYGFEGEVKLERSDIEGRIAELKPHLESMHSTCLNSAKALQAALADVVKSGDEGKVKQIIELHLNNGVAAEMTNGAIQENARYLGKADEMIKAGGDFIFSRQEFEGAMQGAMKAHQEYATRSNVLAGYLQKELHDICGVKPYKREKRIAKLTKATNDYLRENLFAAMYLGVVNENRHWLAILDKKIKAAGGAKSEAVMLAQGV